jgi:hypothetical protein
MGWRCCRAFNMPATQQTSSSYSIPVDISSSIPFFFLSNPPTRLSAPSPAPTGWFGGASSGRWIWQISKGTVLRLVRRVFESKWIETPAPSRERRGGAYIIDIDSSSSSFIFSRLQYNIVRMETFPPSRRPVFISSWFSAQHFIQPLPNPLDMTLFVDELDWKSFFIFRKAFITRYLNRNDIFNHRLWHTQKSCVCVLE